MKKGKYGTRKKKLDPVRIEVVATTLAVQQNRKSEELSKLQFLA